MNLLLLRKVMRNKLASIFFCISILLIFVTFPLALSSLHHAQQQVSSDATYYGRGSYDILVRPPDAKHELEDKLGIVPENYIGFGDGGISIAQWEQIMERSDIEIAAPVASLGYFSGVRTNLAIYPPKYDYNRYLFQYFTTDGINEYAIDEPLACFQLRDEEVDYQYETFFNHFDLMNTCSSGAPMFMLPATYHLLVGIDPEEEKKLTTISFDPIHPEHSIGGHGGWLRGSATANAELVPILEITDSATALQGQLHIDQLDLTDEHIDIFRDRLGLVDRNHPDPTLPKLLVNKWDTDEYDQIIEELIHLEAMNRETHLLDITTFTQDFFQNSSGIYLSEEGHMDLLDEAMYQLDLIRSFGPYAIDFYVNDMGIFYQSGQLPYEEENGILSLKKVDQHLGVPVYRDIKESGIRFTDAEEGEVSFFLDPLEEGIEIGEHHEHLASSPLGIYQLAPVIYIDEETGEEIELQPTFTPGSFVTPAAKGLTNIESAQLIKGEYPIDAIRVKVAGITGYTKEAAGKIDEISDEIRNMGLDVTIVAGASPQKVPVDVEGVGIVEESWTTLGAVGTIVNEWNVTNIILASLFIMVTLLYLVNRMLFWQVNSQEDVLLLHQLGWKHPDITRLSRNEMVSLVLVSSIVAVPILFGLIYWGNLSNMMYLWFGVALILTVGMIFIFIRTKLNRMLQVRTDDKRIKQQKKRKERNSLLGRNFAYFYRHIRSPFVQLVIVSILSSFVYLSLTETAQQTGITLLGDYINLQINQWHTILMVAAYLLAFVTLAESLLSLMKMREKEINNFMTLGWRKTHIFWLYMKEVMLWSGIALFLGSAVSIVLFNTFYPITSSAFIIGAISFIGFYVFVCLLSAILIYRYISKEARNVLMDDQSA